MASRFPQSALTLAVDVLVSSVSFGLAVSAAFAFVCICVDLFAFVPLLFVCDFLCGCLCCQIARGLGPHEFSLQESIALCLIDSTTFCPRVIGHTAMVLTDRARLPWCHPHMGCTICNGPLLSY